MLIFILITAEFRNLSSICASERIINLKVDEQILP